MRNVSALTFMVVATACAGGAPAEAIAPIPTATIDAAPASSAEPDAAPGSLGVISGRAVFVGEEVFPMEAPRGRGQSEHCKDKPIKPNAVIVGPAANGCTEMCEGAPRPIADVIVRLPIGAVPISAGPSTGAPSESVEVKREDCVSSPRVLTMMVGQPLRIVNADRTLHNAAGRRLADNKMLFNMAQPVGAGPATRTFEAPGLHRIRCQIHNWERTFIWVSDHPHAAVTGADGTFVLKGVPEGSYQLEAWHSFYGLKRIDVSVGSGEITVVKFDGSEDEPPENKHGLDGIF